MKHIFTFSISQKSIIIIILVSLVILLSCNNGREQRNTTREDMDTEIRVALTSNINTLDPQETSATITEQVTHSIYNTLITTDGKPELADSWQQSEDGLTWVFYLHKHVSFHNGQSFTANDVKASFMRIKNAPVTSPFHGSLENVDSIIVNDEYTITFVLKYRDFTIPAIFGSSEYSILPSELISTGHNFSKNPVGTGPFKLDRWDDGIKIRLIRNDNFFLETPNIESVEFYLMSDINSQVTSLINGDIDIVPYIIEPELSTLQKQKNINIVQFPIATISVLAMNTRKPPFNSLEFRKAVAMAIDKDRVIKLAYPGGKKANSFWPSNTKYSVDIPEIYNPQAAKEYFDTHPQGEPIILTVPMNFAPHVRAAQLYQNQLSKLGLEVEVQPINWTTWLDQVYGKGNFDMTVIGHTGVISPYQRLVGFLETGSYVGWVHELFNDLMQKIKESTSETEQTQLYKNIFTLMTNDYPFVFVVENTVSIAMDSRIVDIIFDPTLEIYDFTKTRIEAPKTK